LPAINELSKLFDAKFEVNKALNVDNTFANTFYWSSTEFDIAFALSQNLLSGSQDSKDSNGRVRAIRAF
jgi:hypothetical protein